MYMCVGVWQMMVIIQWICNNHFLSDNNNDDDDDEIFFFVGDDYCKS